MPYSPGQKSAYIALNRFGLGARPGDLARAAGDPRGWLKAELGVQDIALISLDDPANADLVGTTPAIQGHFAAEAQRKREREIKTASLARGANGNGAIASDMAPAGSVMAMAAPAMSGDMAGGMAGAGMMAKPDAAKPDTAKQKTDEAVEGRVFRQEALAMARKAMEVEAGFVERLVRFWSNHFAVSVAKSGIVRIAAGAFEREAIRPFVLRSFPEMLLAVERHPVMLNYLDNQQSMGPNSRWGKAQKHGLNENLAREILELHTLGVDGGYTQADVTALAATITGWTIVGREGRLGEPGAFTFNANAHEPGDRLLLGKAYPQGGMGQGEAALNDLARHPSTAHHIAFKLARHFVADEPPPALVERLARVYRDTEGGLRALALALVDAPETWDAPLTKLRTPLDFTLAIRRATLRGPLAEPNLILHPLNVLGQPLWQPPGPNGFSDVAGGWTSAEGMKLRLDFAAQVAHQVKDIGNPLDILNDLVGEAASQETRKTIQRAESREQGLALLFMSPEFQRR